MSKLQLGQQKKDFLQKKKQLEEVAERLKSEYIGISHEIDELLSYLEPWYIFNDIQSKPLVINLWGMTSVGKTSLIKKIFEYLDLSNSLYRFDVRNLLEGDTISDELSNFSKINKHQSGFIFDEFQNARTIDNGFEEKNSGLRGLWDLLDSGQIETTLPYFSEKIHHTYLALKKLMKEGMVVKNGIVVKKSDQIQRALPSYFSQFAEVSNPEKKLSIYLDDILNEIILEFPEYLNLHQLQDDLKTDNQGVLSFFEELIEKNSKPQIHDFSKCVVFIIGNLDEVYTEHDNFNPDLNADTLNKIATEITVSDIKKALSFRFRSEQISRLGNNHIIYPTLTSSNYQDLITMEVGKTLSNIKSKYGIEINVNESVKDILYKESVIPTQGARPVISRINSIIRPLVSEMLKEVYQLKIPKYKLPQKFTWEYESGNLKVIAGNIGDVSGISLTLKFPLKVDNLRKIDKTDPFHHLVSVHEAGHAVLSIVSLQLIPKFIYSKTANTDSGGFCELDLPSVSTQDFYQKYIQMLLGGWLAEKQVFGEENLSDGSVADLNNLTEVATKMVKLYGMDKYSAMITNHDDFDSNIGYCKDKKADRLVMSIINNNRKKAAKILKSNQPLFKEIIKLLLDKSYITANEIESLLKDKFPELQQKIKNPQDYYGYVKSVKSFIKD